MYIDLYNQVESIAFLLSLVLLFIVIQSGAAYVASEESRS